MYERLVDGLPGRRVILDRPAHAHSTGFFPENARWDAELQAVEFGVEIGAWKYAASRLERNGGPEDRRRPRE
jgi:hypothetical protein